MKTYLLLMLACPLWTLAQTLPMPTVTRESLKPIENQLVPTYYGGRYGQAVRSQYMYDGLDIKARNLAPYITASGDLMAIQEFDKYMSGRHTGGWLIAGGIVTSIVGVIVAVSNDHSKEASMGPYSSTGVVSGGTVCYGYCNSVPDRTNVNGIHTGITMLFSGIIVGGIGALMQIPGQHVRRAVQYYNKSLKERTGVSWQLTPYSTLSNSGIGLVGRF